MKGLTEGRIVHYVLEKGRSEGAHRAAIVTKVTDNEQGLVNLSVFLDGENDSLDQWLNPAVRFPWPYSALGFATIVSYSEEPLARTWHWIEQA